MGGVETEPDPEGTYVVGADLARHRAWTVAIVLRTDVVPWYTVERVRMHRVLWPAQQAALEQLHSKWNNALLVYDSTGGGDSTGENLRVPAVGYNFGAGGMALTGSGTRTSKAKYDLLTTLKQAAEALEFRVHFWPELDFQLRHYTWEQEQDTDDDGEAVTWDDLMALALAIHGARSQPGTLIQDDEGAADRAMSALVSPDGERITGGKRFKRY